jgi:hypothetical protein
MAVVQSGRNRDLTPEPQRLDGNAHSPAWRGRRSISLPTRAAAPKWKFALIRSSVQADIDRSRAFQITSEAPRREGGSQCRLSDREPRQLERTIAPREPHDQLHQTEFLPGIAPRYRLIAPAREVPRLSKPPVGISPELLFSKPVGLCRLPLITSPNRPPPASAIERFSEGDTARTGSDDIGCPGHCWV